MHAQTCAVRPVLPWHALPLTVSGALRESLFSPQLAPEAVVADVPRLREELAKAPTDGLVLIGRRHLSSNNSWMHNLKPLVRGGNRCTVLVHPEDAARLGLTDGALASVTSRAGKLE